MIAGRMKIMGKDWPEFRPVCRAVTTMYAQGLKPVTILLNNRIKPSVRIPPGLFRNVQLGNVPDSEKLSGILSEAMSPLVQFLIDEQVGLFGII